MSSDPVGGAKVPKDHPATPEYAVPNDPRSIPRSAPRRGYAAGVVPGVGVGLDVWGEYEPRGAAPNW